MNTFYASSVPGYLERGDRVRTRQLSHDSQTDPSTWTALAAVDETPSPLGCFIGLLLLIWNLSLVWMVSLGFLCPLHKRSISTNYYYSSAPSRASSSLATHVALLFHLLGAAQVTRSNGGSGMYSCFASA